MERNACNTNSASAHTVQHKHCTAPQHTEQQRTTPQCPHCSGTTHHLTTPHRIAQHCTAQYHTAHHHTIQHYTAHHHTIQHHTAHHRTIQHRTKQHNMAPRSTTFSLHNITELPQCRNDKKQKQNKRLPAPSIFNWEVVSGLRRTDYCLT